MMDENDREFVSWFIYNLFTGRKQPTYTGDYRGTAVRLEVIVTSCCKLVNILPT